MQISTKLTFIKGAPVSLQGANSQVFFARDPQLDADLVMKQVPKKSIADPAKYFSEASRLYDARHPNVVDVKYACEDQDFIYLAMPKYQGSVHGVLQKRFLTAREVVTLGFDFLSGLHHVHTKGLLHFDVKPSNVLLNDAGRAALADFGLTQRVDIAGLATPEQLYGKQVPPEALSVSTSLAVTADIYQAGFTLYRMANGIGAVEEQYKKLRPNLKTHIVNGSFPDRSFFLPHIPKKLRKVIVRALAVDPNDRHPTSLSLMNELSAVDEMLDWNFSLGPHGEGKWEYQDGDLVRRVRVTPGQGTHDIVVSRVRVDTGKETYLHKDSTAGVTAAKLPSILYDALKKQ